MATRRCPKCGLINPAMTMTCDCGWSFAQQMMMPGSASQDDEALQANRSHARSQIGIGAALMVVGIVITAATYGSASTSGGMYIIAYGPIIFGAVRIVRGLMKLSQ